MITATFTNVQGELITDGLLMVGDASFNGSVYKHFVSTAGVETQSDQDSNSLRYRVFYWKSQADIDAGLGAYVLDAAFDPDAMSVHAPAGGDEIVDVRSVEDKLWQVARDLDETYTVLSAKAMAEKHLLEVVLA